MIALCELEDIVTKPELLAATLPRTGEAGPRPTLANKEPKLPDDCPAANESPAEALSTAGAKKARDWMCPTDEARPLAAAGDALPLGTPIVKLKAADEMPLAMENRL